MLLTIVLVIIVLIFIIFFKHNQEYFSQSKTNVIFSNYATENSEDKFANVNEEVLVVVQVPNIERKPLYTYIRTPIGKYLAVITKKVDITGETVLNTILVKMDKIVTEIMPLLKKSGALDINTTDNIKYYVKLLTDPKYQVEQTKLSGVKEVYRKYNLCIKSRMSSGIKKATESCKKEYNI